MKLKDNQKILLTAGVVVVFILVGIVAGTAKTALAAGNRTCDAHIEAIDGGYFSDVVICGPTEQVFGPKSNNLVDLNEIISAATVDCAGLTVVWDAGSPWKAGSLGGGTYSCGSGGGGGGTTPSVYVDSMIRVQQGTPAAPDVKKIAAYNPEYFCGTGVFSCAAYSAISPIHVRHPLGYTASLATVFRTSTNASKVLIRLPSGLSLALVVY